VDVGGLTIFHTASVAQKYLKQTIDKTCYQPTNYELTYSENAKTVYSIAETGYKFSSES